MEAKKSCFRWGSNTLCSAFHDLSLHCRKLYSSSMNCIVICVPNVIRNFILLYLNFFLVKLQCCPSIFSPFCEQRLGLELNKAFFLHQCIKQRASKILPKKKSTLLLPKLPVNGDKRYEIKKIFFCCRKKNS